jgi:hypothetical protein
VAYADLTDETEEETGFGAWCDTGLFMDGILGREESGFIVYGLTILGTVGEYGEALVGYPDG